MSGQAEIDGAHCRTRSATDELATLQDLYAAEVPSCVDEHPFGASLTA